MTLKWQRRSKYFKKYKSFGLHEKLYAAIPITEAGYVYIYLSNDNTVLGGANVEVHFDDFKVTHTKSPVVQRDEYYPFGLAFNSYSRENSTPNQYCTTEKRCRTS